jgi:hypothetical protein
MQRKNGYANKPQICFVPTFFPLLIVSCKLVYNIPFNIIVKSTAFATLLVFFFYQDFQLIIDNLQNHLPGCCLSWCY